MPTPPRWIRLLSIALVPAAAGWYGLWYLFNTHEMLATCYTSLNPHFYEVGQWPGEFFTPKIKAAGNYWCVAALLFALIWAWVVKTTPWPTLPKAKLNRRRLLTLILVFAGGLLLALPVAQKSAYCTDEVFSALAFAELPLFQTISYYPLPNNHLFFNALNGMLPGGSDLVLSGRVLSALCYGGVLLVTWRMLGAWFASQWLRGFALLAMALQFHTWGFSAQARGYELLLLLSATALWAHSECFQTQNQRYLPLLCVANVLGIFTVPSYLYWWVGLTLAGIFFQVRLRQWVPGWWRAQLCAAAAVLLLYLPLLTFSGADQLTGNRYVVPVAGGVAQLMEELTGGYLRGLSTEWFAVGGVPSGSWLLLLAAALWAMRRQAPRFAATAVALLSAFPLMALLLQKLPFYRNLGAQGWLALFVLLAALSLLSLREKWRPVVGASLLLFCMTSFRLNFSRMPQHLYYQNVNGYFETLKACAPQPAPTDDIWLDDDCFYWWYVLRKATVGHTPRVVYGKSRFSNQAFGITGQGKTIPSLAHYKSVGSCAEFAFWNEEKE